MAFCSSCKAQVVDKSTSVCPNCGASLENSGEINDTIETVSTADTSQNDAPSEGKSTNPDQIPAPIQNDDDNLQICDPGDMLCSEQTGTDISEKAEPIGQSTPPPPSARENDDDDSEDLNDSSKDTDIGIKKLSDEQVNNIRSNLLKGESEYVSAQDASSIIHDLSKSSEGPTLQRKDQAPSSIPNKKASFDSASLPPAMSPGHQKATNSMVPPTSAPMRKVAYFHKKFIQLTGSIHPSSGEELVIDDRHYILKPKKIKPQYTIGVFSVLVVILLFIIGKQFISPTLPGSGSIIGVILGQDGRPLITGADIALPESGKEVVSDAIGFFRFKNVPTGVYVIRYTLPDGRVGIENISVANDQITMLSLDTENARVAQHAKPTSSQNNQVTFTSDREAGSERMPQVPEEKKVESNNASAKPGKKQYSALKLRANVDGAKLIVNGEVFGAGNMTYKKLAPGKHKAKVTKSGYIAWTGNVQLEPNETYSLNVKLEKIQTESQEEVYSADDFYQSGRTMLADGNIDAAVQDFTEAINLKPSMADAYDGRAEAYLASRKTIPAEADYIRAGEIYALQKRNKSALNSFTKAIDVNSKSVLAFINRGDLHRRMDQNDNALKDFKAAVSCDKNNFRANYELGKMYFSMGKHKDADKRLRNARDLNPENPKVYHYLMLNYFARDDFGKVKKTYGDFKDRVTDSDQQAFKENPRFDAILRIVGEYERP